MWPSKDPTLNYKQLVKDTSALYNDIPRPSSNPNESGFTKKFRDILWETYGLTLEEIHKWDYCGGQYGKSDSKHSKKFIIYCATHPNFVPPSRQDQCLCTHEIKENCYITNDKIVIVLGNCCINRFIESGTNLKCTKCNAKIKRYIGKDLCPKCSKIKICTSCGLEHSTSSQKCAECREEERNDRYPYTCEICDYVNYSKYSRTKCEGCAHICTGHENNRYCENCSKRRVKWYDIHKDIRTKNKPCTTCNQIFAGELDESFCKQCKYVRNIREEVHEELLTPLNLYYPVGKYKYFNFIAVHKGGRDKKYITWARENLYFEYWDFIEGINLFLRLKKIYTPLWAYLKSIADVKVKTDTFQTKKHRAHSTYSSELGF